MRKLVLLATMILTAAAPASAQKSLERAKAALPRDVARQLEQTIASARSRGLPTEPLVDKALEGVAKKAPPQAVLNAVRQRAELLARADAALRPMKARNAANVTAAADAMQRGLDEKTLQRALEGRRQGEPVGVALHTLADLMERGVPVDVAVDVLHSWRERGGRSEELREFPAAVERLIRQGVSPSAAGKQIRDQIRSGRRAGPPPGKPGAGRNQRPNRPGRGNN